MARTTPGRGQDEVKMVRTTRLQWLGRGRDEARTRSGQGQDEVRMVRTTMGNGQDDAGTRSGRGQDGQDDEGAMAGTRVGRGQGEVKTR